MYSSSEFLVDPINITKYNSNNTQLELLVLFWVTAAGKNGVTSAKCLERFLSDLKSMFCVKSPFKLIQLAINNKLDISKLMKKAGIGCYNQKAKTFKELAFSRLNLKTCTVQDLETIKGIGKKTSRCFMIHSRKNQKLAGLDTHILKFLRDNGVDAPQSTPSGKKYDNLEKEFLKLADKVNKSVSDFDLAIWNHYRNSKEPMKV